MAPIVRSAVIVFLVLTGYLVLGSLISESMRFPYGYVSLGAVVLFFLTGFWLARQGGTGSAVVATAVVGFTSSVAAWVLLGLINPMRRNDPAPQTEAIGEVMVLLTLAAVVAGGMGALAGRRGGGGGGRG